MFLGNLLCITGLVPTFTSLIASEIDWHYAGRFLRNTTAPPEAVAICVFPVDSLSKSLEAASSYVGSTSDVIAEVLRGCSTVFSLISGKNRVKGETNSHHDTNRKTTSPVLFTDI